MKIEIDVDNKTLEELINENIKDVDKSTITKMCEQAICEYLSDEKVLDKLIVEHRTYGANELSPVGKELIKDIFKSETEWSTKLRNTVIDYLSKNYDYLVKDAIAQSVASMVFGDHFYYEIQKSIARMNLLGEKR